MKIYGKSDIYETLTGRFKYVLEEATKQTGHKAVVLIDEYDKPMKYVLSYRDDKRQVHKIGVNISSASRTVIYTNCIILGR